MLHAQRNSIKTINNSYTLELLTIFTMDEESRMTRIEHSIDRVRRKCELLRLFGHMMMREKVQFGGINILETNESERGPEEFVGLARKKVKLFEDSNRLLDSR